MISATLPTHARPGHFNDSTSLTFRGANAAMSCRCTAHLFAGRNAILVSNRKQHRPVLRNRPSPELLRQRRTQYPLLQQIANQLQGIHQKCCWKRHGQSQDENSQSACKTAADSSWSSPSCQMLAQLFQIVAVACSAASPASSTSIKVRASISSRCIRIRAACDRP